MTEKIEFSRAGLLDATDREYIRRLVDAAPPLTAVQRARLAVLLRPVDPAVQLDR